MKLATQPAGAPLQGELTPPGDKSISHRALIFACLAQGASRIRGLLESEDVRATARACRQLGMSMRRAGDEWLLEGVGARGLQPPAGPLDMGNSGTAMRLLAGVLAAQPFASELIGDASLSRRPMRRIVTPLERMGALIETAEGGTPPLRITGNPGLRGIDYESPVASAQVKSCLLLAGLYASGHTSLREPLKSRDHTEKMLPAFGVPLFGDCGVRGGSRLTGTSLRVPADISSAAFFLVAAALVPGSDLLLRDVGLNATRDGIVHVLQAMGADLDVRNRRLFGGEPVGDLRIRYAGRLRGVDIPVARVPALIDELPVILALAATAEGTTRLRGAAELRVKESDRLAVMGHGLQTLGVRLEEYDDGMDVHGGPIAGGAVDGAGDHRCAMSFCVLGQAAAGPLVVAGCENIDTSYPGFVADLTTVGGHARRHSAGASLPPAKPHPLHCLRFAAAESDVPVIAIDGPGGSGKGTIAARLARDLGWHLLDSGALYRLVALAALDRGVAEDDEATLARIAVDLVAEFVFSEQGMRVVLDGLDVGVRLRSEEVSAFSSRIAALPGVRAALVRRQRAFRQVPGLVADGRDMGTVIFPDAKLKIFLTASAEARAARRHKQLKEKGENVNLSRLFREIEKRDGRDRSRAVSPLKPADDAHVIDSTELSIGEVLRKVHELLEEPAPSR